MERFLIDPSKISPEEIKADLMAYLEQKPEYLRWKGFFNASAGQIIIDYIVGYAAFLIYHITVARREAYLAHAENRSSHIGISQNLSYSVFRGRNARIDIFYAATVAPIVFSKWQVIGSIADQDIIVLEDTVINTGDTVAVPCTIGTIAEESLLVDSGALRPFRFKSSAVSEDVRLYQNNVELPVSKEVKDLASGTHVLLSNAFGAVDLYYLNELAPFYNTGDQFKIEFIRLANPTFTLNDIQLTESGFVTAVINSFYLPPEANSEIKVNAPLYFETQYQIRGRNDFKKIFKTLNPTIIDTNGFDYSPSVVELTYIRDNLSNFNEVEKQEFIDTLSRDRRNPYGTLLSIIRNPNRTRLGLNIQIKLNKTTSENISSVIRSILAEYEEKLQRIIDFEEIENKIADLGYIKSVRVTNTLQVWAISTFYTRLDFTVETTGCAEPKFEFFRHLRRSADFEPIWPLIEGDRVQDGRVIWEARDERTCNLPAWEPEIDYQIGAKVIPTAGPGTLIYVCVKRENLSNTFEPVWNDAIGSITMDRELIWMAVEVSGTPSIWQAEYNYELGDTVYPTSSTDYALQVVGYRSRSGMTPPVWPIIGNIQFEDGDIRWMSRDRDRATVTLNWDEYTLINESLSIG